MANTRERLGGIVAFEGHSEIVTTQLRLLPTSPQILILPGVQCYLQQDLNDGCLSIPAFIRQTHNALMERNKVAREYLERSTADNKRLVFMNGSAASAQALCIRAIMRHHTDGDNREAETIFERVVQKGLAGLERQWETWTSQSCREPDLARVVESNQRATAAMQSESEDEREDPTTKAMRAADALDRETENLQQSNELDLTLTRRPRCNSLPLYGYTDSFNDAAPFFVFGAQTRSPKDANEARRPSTHTLLSPTTPKFAVTHYDDAQEEATYLGMTASCAGESYGPPPTTTLWSPMTHDYFTPRTTKFDPKSPETSIFRESSLLEVASPCGLYPPPSHRRIRSLDRLFPMAPKYGDVIDDLASSPTAVATPTPRVETFGYKSKNTGSWITLEDGNDTHDGDAIKGARTITIKPSRGTIVFDPVPKDRKRRTAQSVYVDKGTDAKVFDLPQPAFEPVFPVEEDLVIHLKDEVCDLILDRAIKAFRDGVYPILSPPEREPEKTQAEMRQGPSDTVACREQADEPMSHQDRAATTMASPPMDSDEYDPFAYTQPSRPITRPAPRIPQLPVEHPPTPDRTPPPSIVEKQDKFREFAITSRQTAVAVQNSLRSVLNGYFPPETQGYRQFQFSLLPELEGLWEPIFRRAEPSSPRKDSRRMDQIIAIGSQRDVKREYTMTIAGQLERLGTKTSGRSRSGRLDFRYLVANAMQAYTARPLADQASDNPFNNPYLLATLLIPQLETYLALHSEVRYLLLEYPPEHLGTIIAMQKLVGVDLMKVAQIIDSRSSDRLPFTHIRGASIGSQASSPRRGVISSMPPQPRQSRSSHSTTASEAHLSKANFLLTSSASESEIATFVATMSKILADVSDFYIPEPQPNPKKPSPRKHKPAPLQSTFTAFPKPSITVPSTPITPSIPGAPPRPSSPAVSTRAPSVSDTLRTTRTSKSRATHTRSRSKTSRRGKQAADAASMYTFDPAEDSDYDVEEKRLMPLFLQKPKRRKGDSRKALKFLGLA